MKNTFEIKDDYVEIIVNYKGEEKRTKIDKEDLDKARAFPKTWHYCNGYIQSTDSLCRNVSLHRLVMDTPKDLVVDHINHDTLDNRKANLRNVTPMENAQNMIRPPHWCKI